MEAFAAWALGVSVNQTADTWWYAPDVFYRAKMGGADRTIQTLSAWGAKGEPSPA